MSTTRFKWILILRPLQKKVHKREWNAATLKEHSPRPCQYDDLVCSENASNRRGAATYDLLRNLLEYGFAFVDGVSGKGLVWFGFSLCLVWVWV